MKYGIDISGWQKNIDYETLSQNIGFAIVRIGYGVQYLPNKQKDSELENHYYGLIDKVPVGGYYYQYANEEGEGIKEAQNCLLYIENKQFNLPIYYDIEDKSVLGLDKDILTNIALEFCETIEANGYKAGIYASKSVLEDKLDTDRISKYSIWCASYGKNDSSKYEWAKYNGKHEIWQYTSRGEINGINGYVDMNIMYEDDLPSNANNSPSQGASEPTIYSGDDSIRTIQQWLQNNYGYSLRIDGYFGNETKKYLTMALQHELNTQFNASLVEDGIFGKNTFNACINVRKGANGNITWLIQAMLVCNKFDIAVDGDFGNNTENAVRKFQLRNGLSADGIVGKNTFNKLFR